MSSDDAAAMTPRAVVETFEALARFDLEPALDRLRAPTLVIAGEDDPLIPIRHARELSGRLPCARFVPYRGVSHGVPLEAPAALAKSPRLRTLRKVAFLLVQGLALHSIVHDDARERAAILRFLTDMSRDALRALAKEKA